MAHNQRNSTILRKPSLPVLQHAFFSPTKTTRTTPQSLQQYSQTLRDTQRIKTKHDTNMPRPTPLTAFIKPQHTRYKPACLYDQLSHQLLRDVCRRSNPAVIKTGVDPGHEPAPSSNHRQPAAQLLTTADVAGRRHPRYEITYGAQSTQCNQYTRTVNACHTTCLETPTCKSPLATK